MDGIDSIEFTTFVRERVDCARTCRRFELAEGVAEFRIGTPEKKHFMLVVSGEREERIRAELAAAGYEIAIYHDGGPGSDDVQKWLAACPLPKGGPDA